jgi:hypothetical protein
LTIIVYKKGNKDVVDGMACEIVRCVDVAEMNAQLLDGCVHDVKSIYDKDINKELKPSRDSGHKS